jgi:hypothetical protein
MMKGLPDQPTGPQKGLRLIDIGPTFMKLFGLPEPEGLEGRSIL